MVAKELIAFVLVGAWPPEGEVVTLDVAPRHRRRGLGRELLRWADQRLRDCCVTAATLHVQCDNVPAIRLYESEGYGFVRTLLSYYPGGEDAAEMGKRLDPDGR